jgi:hypothetical protein
MLKTPGLFFTVRERLRRLRDHVDKCIADANSQIDAKITALDKSRSGIGGDAKRIFERVGGKTKVSRAIARLKRLKIEM